MDEYRQHPSKVARWGGDSLVPLAEGPAELATVWAPLPLENEQQFWEGMNARLIADGIVELRAVPAYAYDLNFGDHLSTMKSAEGALVCTGIIHPSEEWTYRVWLSEDPSTGWRQIAEDYAKAGCPVDVISRNLIAISCHRELAQVIAGQIDY
jgi:hypothetical protein